MAIMTLPGVIIFWRYRRDARHVTNFLASWTEAFPFLTPLPCSFGMLLGDLLSVDPKEALNQSLHGCVWEAGMPWL